MQRAPRIEIRDLRKGDAEALLANIRPQDVAECEALLGAGKMAETLRESVRVSTMLWVGTADGEIVAIFGVAPIQGQKEKGVPWLMGTRLIDIHRRAFIRLNRPYIARMLATFPHLMNIVDARNTKSIAWLGRMGFVLHEPCPWGVGKLPFHLFTMDA
jgi:hypothetical protein